MIIYKDLKRQSLTADYLRRINELIDQINYSGKDRHSTVVELLIDFSDLETALNDCLSKEEEIFNPLVKVLRQAGKTIGHILLKSWNGETELIDKKTGAQLADYLSIISSYELPESITIKVPEGYAFYGYYPETYIQASEKFFNSFRPKEAAVIGVRSIGTSFSSAAAALLESKGCRVSSFTVRPKGEYTERHLSISRELASELLSPKDRYFLIVDEGPGLSGSSFGIVAEELSGIGVPDDKIIFISSWEPDGSGLISEIGRRRWKTHRKFSSGFDDTWIRSGRLAEYLPFSELTDVSNGKWRSLFYDNNSDFPATYPQEERKKYLCSKYPIKIKESIFRKKLKILVNKKNDKVYLIKFVGLGRYGKSYYERAQILSHSMFIPPVIGFENGFLIYEFIKGSPLRREEISYEMLNTEAEYMNYLCNRFPASPSRNFEEMFAMITENVFEHLGAEWKERLERKKRKFVYQYSRFAVEVDGHMFPHEWIVTDTNCYKTDGITHHADQFFPGCQNIAWDIAGSVIESNLDRAKEQYLVNRFCTLSGQRQIPESLGFYKMAYLAFRMGYSALTSNILIGTPDGEKVKKQTDWYSVLLQREIMQQCS